MRRTIISLTLTAMIGVITVSCGNGSSSSSSNNYGYGEYHNVNTGEQQPMYKGSVEQQNDISTLDKMVEDGY